MSQFRQDIVSGDWIVMAPERAKRPHDLFAEKKRRVVSPKRTCPFEDLKKSGNWPPIATLPAGDKWRVAVIPNKYPALMHEKGCTTETKEGPYRMLDGVGHHELVVTRDHMKSFRDLTPSQALEVFQTFRDRFRFFYKDTCMVYTSAFFNWGPTAGASVYHPHYQMLTLPIVPPDIARSLRGSKRYFKAHRRCVHCEMVAFEKRQKKRVIAENRWAIAFAPFISHQPFEVRVFPKEHLPFFEKTSEAKLRSFVKVLQSVLSRMGRYLNDPDLNFFIHTAPLRGAREYRFYHWHVEVLPKITVPAGFELSTGVDINVINPEWAAGVLRGRRK